MQFANFVSELKSSSKPVNRDDLADQTLLPQADRVLRASPRASCGW
jgi:hypothetical protein